jgi:hypothetical protein
MLHQQKRDICNTASILHNKAAPLSTKSGVGQGLLFTIELDAIWLLAKSSIAS